jgi:hypothetical protein
MITHPRTKTHWSFWLIGSVALLWNLAGSLNFPMQLQAGSLVSMHEPFHTIVANRPSWATAAFGLGVFGGTIGCVLLLLNQRAAIYVLAASFAGIILHLIPYLSPQNLPTELGLGDVVLVFVMPLLVAIFLVWYAYMQRFRPS